MLTARTVIRPGLRRRLAQRLRRSRGASAVEYGLMIAFITIAILGGLTSLGVTLRDDVFQQLLTDMQTYLG